ncbi:MAG: hypothetical protein ACI905_002457, partial [Roseivirga sp.]
MISRLLIFLFLFSGTVAFAQKKIPLRKSLETSERAIRMDVPMTNSIRKAFSEGTR